MKAATSEKAALNESAQPLVKIAHEREYWVDLLADLNQRIPKDYIWITNLEIATEPLKRAGTAPAPSRNAPPGTANPRGGADREGRPAMLMIKGLYLSRAAGNNAGPTVVDEFVKNLKESPLVEPIEEASAGYVRASDDTAEWAFKFVLPLKLRNPINF